MSRVAASSANPPVVAETAAEAGWFSSAMGYLHGGLDVLGAIPEVGAVFDGANGLIYAAEGDYAQAAISGGSAVADLVLGLGTAGKAVKYGAKGVAKLGAKEAAEQLAKQEAKVLAEKEARQLAEQEAKQAAEQAAKKAEKDAAEKAEKDAASSGGKGEGNEGGKVKGGPCDHLKQGSGKGPYRGGAHSKTSKPVNDGKDSHHMPADDASPLPKKDGPAIQMDPVDHHKTSSNGRNGTEGEEYREMIANLLKDGKWREAMAIGIQDIREIAKAIGNSRKYNEAMLEMLEYFKCLERNNLLPMG